VPLALAKEKNSPYIFLISKKKRILPGKKKKHLKLKSLLFLSFFLQTTSENSKFFLEKKRMLSQVKKFNYLNHY